MEILFRVGVANAVVASALAMLAYGITRFWRHPTLGHTLWLIVVMNLITPPLLWIPLYVPMTRIYPAHGSREWSGPNDKKDRPAGGGRDEHTEFGGSGFSTVFREGAAGGERGQTPEDERLGVHSSGPERPGARLRVTTALDSPNDGLPRTPAMSAGVPLRLGGSMSWTRLAAAGWMAGSFVWLIVATIRIVRFHHAVRSGRSAPSSIQALAARVAAELGLWRCPPIRVTEGRISPLVWAVGRRPVLLFPRALLRGLDESQVTTLITHEMAHIRRRDHVVRWVELAAIVMYWWLPTVWWVRRELQRAEEACCDGWVVRLFPHWAHEYASALVQTVDFLTAARPSIAATTIGCGHGHDLRRRCEMVLSKNRHFGDSRPRRLAMVALALMVIPVSAEFHASEPADPPGAIEPSRAEAVVGAVTNLGATDAATEDSAHADAYRALDRPVEVSFDDVPLADVMDALSRLAGVNFYLDPTGLRSEGVTASTPVTIKLRKPVTLRSALNLMLRPLRLDYVFQDEVLRITSKDMVRRETSQTPSDTTALRRLEQTGAAVRRQDVPGVGAICANRAQTVAASGGG